MSLEETACGFDEPNNPLSQHESQWPAPSSLNTLGGSHFLFLQPAVPSPPKIHCSCRVVDSALLRCPWNHITTPEPLSPESEDD